MILKITKKHIRTVKVSTSNVDARVASDALRHRAEKRQTRRRCTRSTRTNENNQPALSLGLDQCPGNINLIKPHSRRDYGSLHHPAPQ